MEAVTGHGYPETCWSCGQRILVSRQQFQHHWEQGVKTAWHTVCPPPWKEQPMNEVPQPEPKPEPDNGDEDEDG